MAVKIRLSRKGTTKKPSYRIVVTDSRNPQQGNSLETVGIYQPQNKQIDVNLERVDHWLQRGAKPTEIVRDLIRKARR